MHPTGWESHSHFSDRGGVQCGRGRGVFFAAGGRLVAAGNVCRADDAQQFVQQAVQTELSSDRDDHSLWLYLDTDRKGDHSVKQWVAETRDGSVHRVLEMNGQSVPEPEQRRKMDSYIHDSWTRSKQRKSEEHDDEQATEMLNMLPQGCFCGPGRERRTTAPSFISSPTLQFRPPDFEARVFAAMAGEMAVDNRQHRIASLQGTPDP